MVRHGIGLAAGVSLALPPIDIAVRGR